MECPSAVVRLNPEVGHGRWRTGTERHTVIDLKRRHVVGAGDRIARAGHAVAAVDGQFLGAGDIADSRGLLATISARSSFSPRPASEPDQAPSRRCLQPMRE